jgi:Prokaryotic E2 family E
LSAVIGHLEEQIGELQEMYPGATATHLPDGTTLIIISDVVLPLGWNQLSTRVQFIVPLGYPMARPDCFWADSSLRLESGVDPQASNLAPPVPGTNENARWFSWHVSNWNPATDTLKTYLHVICNRFVQRN